MGTGESAATDSEDAPGVRRQPRRSTGATDAGPCPPGALAVLRPATLGGRHRLVCHLSPARARLLTADGRLHGDWRTGGPAQGALVRERRLDAVPALLLGRP